MLGGLSKKLVTQALALSYVHPLKIMFRKFQLCFRVPCISLALQFANLRVVTFQAEFHFHLGRDCRRLTVSRNGRFETPFSDGFHRFCIQIWTQCSLYLHATRDTVLAHDYCDHTDPLDLISASFLGVLRLRCVDRTREDQATTDMKNCWTIRTVSGGIRRLCLRVSPLQHGGNQYGSPEKSRRVGHRTLSLPPCQNPLASVFPAAPAL